MNHGELRDMLKRVRFAASRITQYSRSRHDRAARSVVCERCAGQISREGEWKRKVRTARGHLKQRFYGALCNQMAICIRDRAWTTLYFWDFIKTSLKLPRANCHKSPWEFNSFVNPSNPLVNERFFVSNN